MSGVAKKLAGEACTICEEIGDALKNGHHAAHEAAEREARQAAHETDATEELVAAAVPNPPAIERSWLNSPPGRDRNGVGLASDYPVPQPMSEARSIHSLDGDETGGGHRFGTEELGKSEFPETWTDQEILATAHDVAANPDRPPVQQPNGNWKAQGWRDGVPFSVIMKPDGRLWSVFPDDPSWPRNPNEGH